VIQKLSNLFTMLGINAVPAFGWFFSGWNSGTTLVVYWFESVAAALFVAARILRHRAITNHTGHVRYKQTGEAGRHGKPMPFLNHYLPIAIIFSAAHGFFLFMIVFLLNHNGKGHLAAIDWGAVLRSCGLVLLFLVVGFLVDLRGLSKRPFLWIETMASRNFLRVMVMHLTIIGGMFAVGFFGNERAFFGVFMVLKTLNDLSGIFPQWDPERPPVWFSALMNKIPSAHPGQSFEEFWVSEKQAERQRIAANERPYSG
jgi:hypothetical protein